MNPLPDLIDTLMHESAHARFDEAEQRFTHQLTPGRTVSMRHDPRRKRRVRIRIGVFVRLTVTVPDCTTVLGAVIQALAGGAGGCWLDHGRGFYLTRRARRFHTPATFALSFGSRRMVVRLAELIALAAVLIRFNQHARSLAASRIGPLEVPR